MRQWIGNADVPRTKASVLKKLITIKIHLPFTSQGESCRCVRKDKNNKLSDFYKCT